MKNIAKRVLLCATMILFFVLVLGLFFIIAVAVFELLCQMKNDTVFLQNCLIVWGSLCGIEVILGGLIVQDYQKNIFKKTEH